RASKFKEHIPSTTVPPSRRPTRAVLKTSQKPPVTKTAKTAVKPSEGKVTNNKKDGGEGEKEPDEDHDEFEGGAAAAEKGEAKGRGKESGGRKDKGGGKAKAGEKQGKVAAPTRRSGRIAEMARAKGKELMGKFGL
ncbi:MAG: hypothetical protein Q9218_007307, partial [Villophora microphyllina]